jgi:ComF family protein
VIGRAFASLLDLVFPPACAACGGEAWESGSRGLCGDCAARLPLLEERCGACARAVGPLAPPGPCPECRDEDPIADGVLAAWTYEGVPRDLVLALKFRGRLGAAVPLAAGLAGATRARDVPGDLVVPVPLSRRRLRERGYNQAEELARRTARVLGLPCEPRALVRARHTPAQTGLPRAARRRGPRGAFRARRAAVAERCVLLVDDVLTTGATVRASARALVRAGAVRVVAAIACRTERR